MAINYKLIGKRIQKRRLQKGTTQEHFAEYMDVTVGYISQMERGVTKISLDRLSVIAEYLQCSITELIAESSTSDANYLNTEFFQLYQKLTPGEKSMISCLLQTYAEHKNDF